MTENGMIFPEGAEEILERIAVLQKEKERIIIAIDGRCTSGKTTFARILSEKTGIPVMHMDDFFLRKEQRTPERYAEPGGNVDRERLTEEVLIPFREGKEISFRKFIRGIMSLSEPFSFPYDNAMILEGSYSCHPELQKYSGLKIFMDIASEQQLDRVRIRDGEGKVQEFRERWIPLEEKYFEAFKIREICDYVIQSR